jgi:hypothetical protein
MNNMNIDLNGFIITPTHRRAGRLDEDAKIQARMNAP